MTGEELDSSGGSDACRESFADALRDAGITCRHALIGHSERAYARSALEAQARGAAALGQVTLETRYLEILLNLTPASRSYWDLAEEVAKRWSRMDRRDAAAIRLYRRCIASQTTKDPALTTKMRDLIVAGTE